MKKTVFTDLAPKAIGPFSQAIEVESSKMLFSSGNIALDPETMDIVGNTAGEQCTQVMENLKQVLAGAGADFSNIVKTTIYLKDMNDFAEINEVYASYFESDPPARTTIEVSRLPMDVRIEIEAIAYL
jgi:2-iminobutanoate/2-iminopropanoate deaminase